jgi:ABC-type branched-subunit amino acid transport system ATPase component/ABC-type branched-subunit amino acid transport system permease subunit
MSAGQAPARDLLPAFQLAAWAAVAVIGVVAALNVNGYYVFVLANVALLAIVGIGLNVLLGLTGQLSFGHVGFFAIGAYTVAILTTKAGWSFWVAWPAGAAISALIGALLALPALRVKGPYLAMITIAFGFVVEHSAVELGELTGGQNGIMGITAPVFGGVPEGERVIALLAIATTIAAGIAFAMLSRGTWGAAMRAVRDSESAAESIGLNPLALKTVAFAISALLAGIAGGLFAPLAGMVTPASFGFIQSILFVLVVMIGGAGAVGGPIIGAAIVGFLPEFLSAMEEYRLLFFGGLLLVVLWAAPSGVAGLAHYLYTLIRRRADRAGQTASSPQDAAQARAPRTAGARPRAALRASELTMVFGGVRAVQGLSLEAVPGVITSLIGPNGAGKSTALNVLSGFYRPTAGAVRLGERTLQGAPAYRIARLGVARTYQTSQLFGSLTVEENVSLAAARGCLGGLTGSARLRSASARARSRELLAYCGYRGSLCARASDLPHVDRRLVEIARALATDPDVLLLDEPAAGLSGEDKAHIGDLLRGIAGAGVGVLLVEHDMRLVMSISDTVVVLDAGQRLAAGSPAEIQRNPAVREAYLGESGGPGPGVAAPARAAVPVADEALGVGRLTTGYGAAPVLHDVSFHVHRGETLALLGANGAGKSTLMRALAGLHRPVEGGLHVENTEIAQLPAERIVALGLVLVPEGRQVFPELTVLDNIRLGAFLRQEDLGARVEAVLARFPPLRARLNQRAGLLSGGEQQMLAIARGLMAKPRILLLDEPSLGLAPKVIEELFRALDGLRRESMTLLLVDQMAGLALALADRACIIDGGRIVAEGAAAEIAKDAALAEAYLAA